MSLGVGVLVCAHMHADIEARAMYQTSFSALWS